MGKKALNLMEHLNLPFGQGTTFHLLFKLFPFEGKASPCMDQTIRLNGLNYPVKKKSLSPSYMQKDIFIKLTKQQS